MADYFLKAQDDARAYRLSYEQVASGYRVTAARAVGVAGATLPDGTDLAVLDGPVDPSQILVEMILGTLTPCGLPEYKAIAKAAVDTRW